MAITHATQTAQPNDPTKDVSANAWNDDHVIGTPLTITPLAGDLFALQIDVDEAFDDDAEHRFAIVRGGVEVVKFDNGGLDLTNAPGETGVVNLRIEEQETINRLHLTSRQIAGYDSTNTAYFHTSEKGTMLGKMFAPPAEADFLAVGQFQFKFDSTTGAPKLLLSAYDDAGNLTTVTMPLVFTVQTYAASNVTTDRTYDANATTLDEIADVLGTLIADLRAQGVVA